jgi:hypothetical protein
VQFTQKINGVVRFVDDIRNFRRQTERRDGGPRRRAASDRNPKSKFQSFLDEAERDAVQIVLQDHLLYVKIREVEQRRPVAHSVRCCYILLVCFSGANYET